MTIGKIWISSLNRGFLSFLFESSSDKEAVLVDGPWIYEDSGLVLKLWNENFNSLSLEISSLSMGSPSKPSFAPVEPSNSPKRGSSPRRILVRGP